MTSVPPPGNTPTPDSGWGYRASRGARPAKPLGPRAPRGGSRDPLDPLSQRLLQAAGALSVLLILVIAIAWLHGSDEVSLNPIAEAAARTQRQPGSRIAIRGINTLPTGGRMVMHGAGVYNGRTQRSRQTMTMDVPGSAARLYIDAVGDQRMIYMRSTLLTAGLPDQYKWLALQPGLGRSAQTAMAGSTDSESQLELLKATGADVESLGEETVRGTLTTRYRGEVDLQRYAELLDDEGKPTAAREYEQLTRVMPEPIPVEAWLDDAGLLRRMRMVTRESPQPGASPLKMDLTLEFFDFGITPKIGLPAKREVFDSTPLARADLHLLDGSAMGIPAKAGDGPPLSVATFRKRAVRICKAVEPPLERLGRAGGPLARRIKEVGAASASGGSEPGALRNAFNAYGTRYLEPSLDLAAGMMRHLGALSPPPSLRRPVQRLLHFGAVTVEVALAQTRALEVGSIKTVRELKAQLKSAAHKTEGAAKAAKLGACAVDPEDSSGDGRSKREQTA
jgi:hypothetical protein